MKEHVPIGLGPIASQPLREQVYERLRHALMSGQIAPGRKLTSRKLAAELGTSDMPVRSALMRLQALHALEQLANGSMTLPAMTRDRFSDLMTTRLICEPAAARRAVDGLDRAGFLIETLWLQVGPFLRQFSGQFDNDLRGILELDYHDEIVNRLEERDADGAAELLARDIREGYAFLMTHGQFE